MCKYIYRFRPCRYAIDELKDSYLWFSMPKGFNDPNDANLGAFVICNRPILRALLRYCHNQKSVIKQWIKAFSFTGICCFTRCHPKKEAFQNFPGCKHYGVCVEFDKLALEDFFYKPTYHINPCFLDVQYAKCPTQLEQDGEWRILTEDNGEWKKYQNTKDMDPKKFDQLIRLFLSRVSDKFSRQQEERIILGGINIPPHDETTKGYKIKIPNDLIHRIYVHPKCPDKFIEQLYKIHTIKGKIELLV